MTKISVPSKHQFPQWAVTFLLALTGCGGSPPSTPAGAAKTAYPAGWERAMYSDAFWVVTRPLTGDRALTEWFQKGLRRPCEAWSRTENGMQFSVVWARAPGGTGIPTPLSADDVFSMIARRSSDMKEVETEAAAGGGFGEGKRFDGANSRLFVRVGMRGSDIAVLIVRGDTTLETTNPYLRAFFDGFEPVGR